MPLTLRQHNEIMRIIDERRFAALREQSIREEELLSRFPALGVLSERIASLSLDEASARLRKDTDRAGALRDERLKMVMAKQKLITDAGYPSDYLDIRYSCPYCNDTGYAGSVKCGCFKQLESRLLNRESGLPLNVSKENFTTLDTGIYDNSDIIEEFLPRRMTQYDYMTRKGGVIDRVKKYVASFEEPGSHNILMFGAPGTGKTFLTSCIAAALMEQQHSVSYERAGDMFNRMSRLEFSRDPDPQAGSLVQRDDECDLLIIDDLGTEFSTEFTRSKLFSVISNRLSQGRSTIISTNLSMNHICEIYGERVSSRLMGEYMLLAFYGSDLRITGKKGI